MRTLTFALVASLFFVGCASDSGDGAEDATEAGTATVEADTLATAQAEIAALAESGVNGVVTFTEQADGAVLVTYDVTGLTPGLHGFHVHETGSCAAGEDGTPGGAAGGHFAPGGAPHGAPSNAATERHMGDLGNIEAGADGVANGSFSDDVLDMDLILGKAFMIHGGADDLTSQPSGAAGARVGCGLIEMTAGTM